MVTGRLFGRTREFLLFSIQTASKGHRLLTSCKTHHVLDLAIKKLSGAVRSSSLPSWARIHFLESL